MQTHSEETHNERRRYFRCIESNHECQTNGQERISCTTIFQTSFEYFRYCARCRLFDIQEGKQLKINIGEVHTIKAINPRFTVSVPKIDNYVRRYLPAKNFGFLIVSTSKGLMRHDEAEAQKIGGCLVAYVY